MLRRHALASLAALALTTQLFAIASAADDPFTPAITTLIDDAQAPSFSPDGQKLAFTRLVVDNRPVFGSSFGHRSGPNYQPDIWVRDLKTGKDKLVLADARFFGWVGNASIATPRASIDLESGKEVPTKPETKEPVQNRHWSPDGTQMVHWASADSKGTRQQTTLGITDGKGTRPLALEHSIDFDSEGFIDWSPDAKHISFDLLFYRHGNVPVHRIAVVEIASGAVKYLEESAYVHQNWGLLRSEQEHSAPNPWDARSERFLFVSGRGLGESDLYLAEAKGGDVKKLTDDGCSKWSPSFDPAGRRVAFAAGDWGGQDGSIKNPRIRVLDLLTGVEQVIKLAGDPVAKDKKFPEVPCITVAWLPDGSGLVYDWRDEHKFQILTAKFTPPAPLPGNSPVKAKTIGSPKEQVIKALASDNRDVVEWGAENSGDSKDPDVISALRKALSTALKKEDYPAEIISALRYLDAREAAPELIQAFQAKYEPTRCYAIHVIAEWKEKTAIEPLRGLLKTMPENETTAGAAAALAAIGEEDAWPHLQRLAKSTDANARGKIASSLDKVSDPRAVDLLIQLLPDHARLYTDWTGEIDVGEHALEALAKLTGKMLGRNPAVWMAWWDKEGHKIPKVPNPNPGLEEFNREKERRGNERQKEFQRNR